MEKGQVTIKDIARELNISVATVSKALRGLKGVNIETRKAIVNLAKEWNYHPNAVALSLMNNRTNNIGVIIPGLIIPYYTAAIGGIQEVANQHGFNILVCQSNESYKTEITNTQAFISSRVDGLIMSISRETKHFEHLRQIERRGIPLVFFNRVCYEMKSPKVIVDDYEGAFNATEHLILSGRKRIAHIAEPSAAIIEPPLTTVSQPAYEIGKTAAKLLIDLIADKNAHPSSETVVLKTKLVVRKSA